MTSLGRPHWWVTCWGSPTRRKYYRETLTAALLPSSFATHPFANGFGSLVFLEGPNICGAQAKSSTPQYPSSFVSTGPFRAGGKIAQQDLGGWQRRSGSIHDGTGNRGRGKHRASKERKDEEGGDGQLERSPQFRNLKRVSHVDPPF